jgi:hypothetical protein
MNECPTPIVTGTTLEYTQKIKVGKGFWSTAKEENMVGYVQEISSRERV